MNRLDFNPEEREFLREMDPGLAKLRSKAGPCPHPDLLMAVVSGVPIESADAIRQHVALCPICEELSRDLAAYEFPGASAAEDHRIRARWQQRGSPHGSISLWAWFWRPLPIAGVLAILVLVTVIAVRKTASVVQPSASPEIARGRAAVGPTPAPVVTASAFLLQKAAIKVPAASVLIYRGNGDGNQAFLKDLAAALEPYRTDDYAEAVRRLKVLLPKYPDAAEPAYYLGVSQLSLDQNDSAIESLQTARARAGDTLRDDISWYLALAFNNGGKVAEARREVENLCMRAGEYKDRACAAVDELRPR
jgi:hypothetical protein